VTVTDREGCEGQVETRSTLTKTGSCAYTHQRCTNAADATDQPRIKRTTPIPRLICILAHHHTHVQTHTHASRYVSTHLYRCEAPLKQRGLGDRTPASGRVKSQLHSARRQTTWAKIISEKTVVDEVRSHVLVPPSTGLQGTGPAVSVPHTRTHTLDLSVCMPSVSKTFPSEGGANVCIYCSL
jgi:hypothetical protein